MLLALLESFSHAGGSRRIFRYGCYLNSCLCFSYVCLTSSYTLGFRIQFYLKQNPPTPPACESNKQHRQHSTLYIQIESRGEFEGGNPYGTLTTTHTGPRGPDGRRRLRDTGPVFGGRPTRNTNFSSFNTHPQAVEGCPTLAPFSLKINEHQ